MKRHIKTLQPASRRLREAKLDYVNRNSYALVIETIIVCIRCVSKAMLDGVIADYALGALVGLTKY